MSARGQYGVLGKHQAVTAVVDVGSGVLDQELLFLGHSLHADENEGGLYKICSEKLMID